MGELDSLLLFSVQLIQPSENSKVHVMSLSDTVAFCKGYKFLKLNKYKFSGIILQ